MPDEIVITSDTDEVIEAVTDAIEELVEEQNEHVEDIVEELTDTIEELVEELTEETPVVVPATEADPYPELFNRIQTVEERLARLEVKDVTDEIAEHHEEELEQTEESDTGGVQEVLEDIGPQSRRSKFQKFWFGV